MPEEKQLILHMHELLQFLNRQGATTFLTVAQHGLVGDMKAPVDVTYLADTVILLRYFEAMGRVRRAISVIKKRTSAHEDTIREYRIGKQRDHARSAADQLPRRASRRARADRRRRSTDGIRAGVTLGDRSETALILAPVGRDAAIAAGMLREVADCVADLPGPRHAWRASSATARASLLVTEEALLGRDLRGLSAWIDGSARMVRSSLRAADAQGRRARAQSRSRAPARGARQRDVPRTAVPSDDACQPRASSAPGAPRANMTRGSPRRTRGKRRAAAKCERDARSAGRGTHPRPRACACQASPGAEA